MRIGRMALARLVRRCLDTKWSVNGDAQPAVAVKN